MKILLIDDDSELTAMLSEYLAGEGFVADQAQDAATGIARALSGEHEAIVLDVMLPGSSGIDILREIRAHSDVPIVMLTAKGDRADRVTGLELGADDYVTKPYFPPELVARLRAVLRRPARHRDQAERLRYGALLCDLGRREVRWRDEAVELTATEFNLLALLLKAGEQVCTKEDMSLRLFGRRYENYDRSMDVHVSKLRQKLHQATQDAVRIVTVRGVGWRMDAAA